ncbi:MAG: DM13 domain-containing protein [Nitrospira sp.]|nr:DM13 domain-containing protein [Nitrospira sp.]
MEKKIKKICSAVLFMVFGLALPQAYGEEMEKEKMMEKEKGMMEEMITAKLTGAGDHHAAGMVAITKDKKGNQILMITDAKIDKVPDGRVYLAKDGDYTKGVELGKLTQFSGKVEFPIPGSVDFHEYNSVVIWCKKFNIEIGHALFEKGMK